MKRILLVAIAVLVLCGCQAKQTFEKVEDIYGEQQTVQAKKVLLSLPKDAVLTMADADRKLYFCDGYEILVETMFSGDLNRTILELTGYEKDKLTIMEIAISNVKRYECVWSSSGEAGDMIGRAVIVDDGSYHYCLCILGGAEDSGALQQTWTELTESFGI